ncbi:MAG: xylulokinase [Bacillota bacterium]
MKYIISHDMGTSSVKAVLVDFKGKIVSACSSDYATYYPNPAWVEQAPSEYWKGVCDATKGLLEKTSIDKKDIKGMVFATQAMGIIPMDEKGETLYNNISWVDGRAEKQAQSIMKKLGGKKLFTMLAGTPIMGKDVIAKLIWLKEEKNDIYQKTKYFLDVNGFLKYKCTGKMVAELSGASSYGLDLKKKEFLSVFSLTGLDIKKLPPLVKSVDIVGGLTEKAALELGLEEGMPVFGGCDDVQSACIGSGMTKSGEIHIYLGTSAWVCACSDSETKFKRGAAAIQSADPDMNLIVGITEAAGSNIDWVINQFFNKESQEMGKKIYQYMYKQIENIPAGSDHLICTPWMLGERCPISTTTTRATLFNINPEHTREHLLKAVYEGIGYNLKWILENFQKDYNLNCSRLSIIGGGAQNDSWMQIISDITGVEFTVTSDPRSAGALGGAIIALIGLGEIKSFADAKKFVKINKTYKPNQDNREIYDKLFNDYKNIYHSLRKTYKNANKKRFEGDYQRK